MTRRLTDLVAAERRIDQLVAERDLLRSILRKLKAQSVVNPTLHGTWVSDGSDGYMDAELTEAEASLFDAITEETT